MKAQDDVARYLAIAAAAIVCSSSAAAQSAAARAEAERASDIANRSLPRMVDRITRLDTTAVAGGRWIYSYTLTNAPARDIDLDLFKRSMSPMIRNRACTSPDLATFLDLGFTLSFSYSGNDGRFIARFDVTPEMCRE